MKVDLLQRPLTGQRHVKDVERPGVPSRFGRETLQDIALSTDDPPSVTRIANALVSIERIQER